MLRHEFLSRHPASRVLRAYADEVPAFAPSLPMVAWVEAIDEGADGDALWKRDHRWQADVRRLPAFIADRLPPAFFQWTTRCLWDPGALEGTWTLDIGVFGEGPHIVGAHRFVPEGTGCRTFVQGEVRVRGAGFDRLGGIPIGRPLQLAVDHLVHRVFREIVAYSGSVVEGWLDRSV